MVGELGCELEGLVLADPVLAHQRGEEAAVDAPRDVVARRDREKRPRVVRVFPNSASCLRLTRALCAEPHEAWLEDNRYINMELLRKERKEEFRKAAWTSDETASLHNLVYTTARSTHCSCIPRWKA